MKATILTDLELQEVSLVSRGANQGAVLALVKNHKEDEQMEELEKKFQELTDAFKSQSEVLEKSNASLKEAQATITELQKSAPVEEDPSEIEKADLPQSVLKELEEAKETRKAFAEFKDAQIVKELEDRVEKCSAIFKTDESKAEAVDVLKGMTSTERTFLFETVALSAEILSEAAKTIEKSIGGDGGEEVNMIDIVVKEAKELSKDSGITFEKAKIEILRGKSQEERAQYEKGE